MKEPCSRLFPCCPQDLLHRLPIAHGFQAVRQALHVAPAVPLPIVFASYFYQQAIVIKRNYKSAYIARTEKEEQLIYKLTLQDAHRHVACTSACALSLRPDANVRIGLSQSVMLDGTSSSIFYQVRTFLRNSISIRCSSVVDVSTSLSKKSTDVSRNAHSTLHHSSHCP